MPEIFETDVESLTRCEPEDVEYNNYEECIMLCQAISAWMWLVDYQLLLIEPTF